MSIGRREFMRQTASAAGLGALAGPAQADLGAPGDPFTFAVVADPHCREPIRPGLERYGTAKEKFLRTIRTMDAAKVALPAPIKVSLTEVGMASLRLGVERK